MTPKKAAENPRKKSVDRKPKKGVKKKLSTAKSQAGMKSKTPSVIDLSASVEIKNSEDVLPKNKKAKSGNKRKQNEDEEYDDEATDTTYHPRRVPATIKNNKTTRVYPIEPCQTECVPPKKKKTRLTKTVQRGDPGDEVIAESPKQKTVRNSKATRINKQNNNQNNLKVVHEARDDDLVDSADCVPKQNKKGKAYKRNDTDMKIILANEVIRKALTKNPIVKTPSRLGRSKKAICEQDESVQDVNNEPIKKLDRIDPLLQQAADSSESPVKQKLPKKKKTLSRKSQTLDSIIAQTSQNRDTVKESKEKTEVFIRKDINSINSNECTAPDSTVNINNGTLFQKPNKIDYRKSSGNSSSTCLSWTKDISSSGADTCVTVNSNDIVRIDKRLPVVKLTNVDHKIKELHYFDNIIEENSFDSHRERSHCHSDFGSVSITNLNVAQTLNLSTSSLTSVISNKIIHNNCHDKKINEEKIIKLRQNLVNLSHKMKNFDLEMIDWIGYGNETNDANVDKLHNGIFDVLYDESEVIRYCKEIRRVLVGGIQSKQSIEGVKDCPNAIGVTHPDSQSVDCRPEDDASKDYMDDCYKKNRDILEKKPESQKDNDLKPIPERVNISSNRKSFDKDIDFLDNDDDALSLFAESLTGLESSRKNSSLTVSVSNDKNLIDRDFNESFLMNERVCNPISNVEEYDKPSSYRNITIVKKQTADSSTRDNKHLITVSDCVSGIFNVNKIRVNCNQLQKNSSNAANNKLNGSLFSNSVNLSDVNVRSPIEVTGNFSNRSSEYQNDTGAPYAKSFQTNRLNVFQDIGTPPLNVTKDANNMISEIRRDTNRKFVGETENNILAIPDVDPTDHKVQHQLAIVDKQMHVVASSIFRGVCFFNLASSCKKMLCTFPHRHIDITFVKRHLKTMKEDMFIKETMYLVKWPILKRKYGMCFVEECIRRNLTILLLQFVKDLIIKFNKKNRHQKMFTVEVIEATLLHLNELNIENYADLLRSKIQGNMCLCDQFMKIISETQNFSRFKNIFITLTLFMSRIGRSYSPKVAEHLLERLCILPYDDALALALMKIISKTNPSIFSNPMMGTLENQLSNNNVTLYKELINWKAQIEVYNQNLTSPPTQSPCIAPSNVSQQTTTSVPRADSPDTTNTDFMKTTEPTVTRTITINHTIDMSNLNAESESSEESKKTYESTTPGTTSQCCLPSLMSLKVEMPRGEFAPREKGKSPFPKFHRRPPKDPY